MGKHSAILMPRMGSLVVCMALVATGAARGQCLSLIHDRAESPAADAKEFHAAAKTELQKQVAEVLATKGWPRNYEDLKGLLKDVEANAQVEALLPFLALHEPAIWIPSCNAAATYLLGDLGEPAVPALRKLLDDKDARQREAAASALAHMAHKSQLDAPKPGAKAVAKLAELLAKDESVGVRREAARALYSYGSASLPALEQIRAALKDKDEMVRGMALEALGAIASGDDAAVQAAIEQVKQAKYKDFDSLQKMGPAARAAVPMLLEMQQVKTQGDLSQAADAERAIAWIWETGPAGPEHLELILKALPSGTAATAAQKLAGMDLPAGSRDAARAALLQGLDFASYWSGQAYAQAIGRHFAGDKAMVAELESRLDANRPAPTRLHAAAALFRVTGEEKRTVEVLAAEVEGKAEGPREDEVRGAAATMLAEFGPRGRAALPQIRQRWEKVVDAGEQGNLYDRAKLAPTLWKLTGRAREPIDALLKDVAGKDGAYAEQTGEALIEMAPLLVDRVKDIAPVLDALGDWGPDRRWWAARVIAAIGPCEQSRKALPALERLMREDGSEYTRRIAAAAVWAVTREPQGVAPAYVRLLGIRNRNVYHTLPLLASMGPAASEALPALRQLAALHGWSVLSAEANAAIAAIERKPACPDEAAFAAWWDDLAGADADRSVSALWSLARAGEEALAFVAKRSGPGEDKSVAGRVRQLVKELDDDRFRVREQASAKLLAMLPEAEPDLREALKATKSKEVETRLEAILRAAPDHGLKSMVDATAADIRRAFRVRQLRELMAWLRAGPER